ncbi:TPA: hypothetical protein DEP94_03105 [Candidatus Nomurabacteria bacterium]|nr:hypothetical protein [Candidatus Nomurabacteria bacterium]
MDFLKNNLWWMAFVVAVFVYLNFLQPKPCDSPIQYKIGTIDAGFGLSETKLKSTLVSASKIWAKPLGKDLFEYNSNGKLTVNLIYDNRQKTTQINSTLKADVEKTNTLAGSVKKEYETLMQDLAINKQAYTDELTNFNAEQTKYSTQVDYWNNQGGAPADVYNNLTKARDDLIKAQQILETKRLAINNSADKINSFIEKYNLLVATANQNIDVINQTAGQEFQEGTYDPNTNTINIYEFSTQDKLTRVLAHELGHALSIDHNTNPTSIMYSLNKSNTLYLSKEDVSSLKVICKIKE